MTNKYLSHPICFWSGAVSILFGVSTHIPMYFHSAKMGFKMVGMGMGWPMTAGMFMICIGFCLSVIGVLPEKTSIRPFSGKQELLKRLDRAKLNFAHGKIVGILAVALAIDVMKPATLGFVIPGMKEEYGLTSSGIAVFPLTALIGTTLGSVIWGYLADLVGRRSAVILSAMMFIGTSICGAMPTFSGNVSMCFFMGLSAGGLLPVTFTMIAEVAPFKHRGWILVVVGGIGTSLGYFMAAVNASIFEPLFGWRSLWLAGIPSGLILIMLNRFLPESPRYLASVGKVKEMIDVLNQFGVKYNLGEIRYSYTDDLNPRLTPLALFKGRTAAITFGLSMCGVSYGLTNFGFILWLPDILSNQGIEHSVALSIFSKSALYSIPGVALIAILYRYWSSRYTLILFTAMTAFSVLGMALVPLGADNLILIQLLMVFLLISVSGVIALLLPYSTEIFPQEYRATGSGFVAASSKFGGIIGSILGLFSFYRDISFSAILITSVSVLAIIILLRYAVETKNRRLEEINSKSEIDGSPLNLIETTLNSGIH